MGGLLTDLQVNAQSLAAQSLGVQIAGKNLANANTVGYSRERVDLGVVVNGQMALGVQALGVSQIRDQLLDQQVTRETSQTGFLQTQSDNLTTAQSNLGESINSAAGSASIGGTGSGTMGISAALSSFFNAFDSLSASPTDTGAKQVLLGKAGVLTNQINTADSRLQKVQSDITTQVTGDVSTVNGLLSNIATLNGQIQKTEIAAPDSAVDLRDQRQADLEKLAQFMDFTTTTTPGGHGQIQVNAQDASGNNVLLVDKTTVEGGGVTFNGTNFSGGAPATTLALQGGSLAGGIAARDGAIQHLRDNLATTATQLKTAVNAAYNPTSATGNFFQSSPASGLIALDSTLNVNTLKTTDTGNSGANELALAVAQVSNKSFSTSGGDLINGTIGGFYSQTVSGFGQSLSGVQTKLSDQQSVQQMVTSQRDSVSGVSQDEELTNLIKFQRAYQASAQVISVINNLLGVVVNGLGIQ